MKVIFDENGYIKSFAVVGDLKGALEFSEAEIDAELLSNLKTDFKSYHLIDGKFVKDEYKMTEILHNIELAELRARRETECFEVVNRSTLWYNTLTEEQKVELNAWYHAWLDVTETLAVPEKPEWLK